MAGGECESTAIHSNEWQGVARKIRGRRLPEKMEETGDDIDELNVPGRGTNLDSGTRGGDETKL